MAHPERMICWTLCAWFCCLAASDAWRNRSGGAFDPRVEVMTRLWSRAAGRGRAPEDAELAAARVLLARPAWRRASFESRSHPLMMAALRLESKTEAASAQPDGRNAQRQYNALSGPSIKRSASSRPPHEYDLHGHDTLRRLAPPRPSCQPARGGDQPLPASARAQPGRLASLGARGDRPSSRREQADLFVDRLLGLPLVPCDGARKLREPRHRRGDERALHQHQG